MTGSDQPQRMPARYQRIILRRIKDDRALLAEHGNRSVERDPVKGEFGPDGDPEPGARILVVWVSDTDQVRMVLYPLPNDDRAGGAS